ncbi:MULTISPECIES: biotin transporter BioY [Bacillus]|uniref:Biotin transporter n=2 Tax=Bacillus TaxID=1386 RepID=A0A0M4FX08_9BACI|nr:MULTISPECIES: biotin transporter BioY [Bacillus]ALC81538.1 biotin synthase [Bacillus gobiensis]MBP1080591.1 biotin transport system substrate-specific component [Bacillus capparidis]MED1094447.1 biotin transporter BioY [Bacillus capparidis]
MNHNNSKLRKVILCGMFAAITAVFAQIEIPLPFVPISGQTLAVGLTATILGSRLGSVSMICYAAIGAIGAPVFAGFKGGAQIIAGPTGGYIIGFVAAAFLTGWILERTVFTLPMAIVANVAGMIVTLAFGAVQLKLVLDLSWTKALAVGVYPFLVVGVIKAFLASIAGIQVRNGLIRAKLLKKTTQAM